jgi:hypothetical protein
MVTERKKTICAWLLAISLAVAAILAHYYYDPWGFYRKVSPEEAALRIQVVQTAESYLGSREEDGSHEKIIDLYNSQDVLPVGYVLQYTDSWCAAFVSAVSIRCGLTDIIPTECGCERQIELFKALGTWEEQDSTIPLPGDLIYYDWNMEEKGECTGWADHVGIVVGTKWPYLKVIEGNFSDCVGYHYLKLDDIQIRGFARPDYNRFLHEKTP